MATEEQELGTDALPKFNPVWPVFTGSFFEWRAGSGVHGADMVREMSPGGIPLFWVELYPQNDESRAENIVQWLSICLDCVRLRFDFQHCRIHL